MCCKILNLKSSGKTKNLLRKCLEIETERKILDSPNLLKKHSFMYNLTLNSVSSNPICKINGYIDHNKAPVIFNSTLLLRIGKCSGRMFPPESFQSFPREESFKSHFQFSSCECRASQPLATTTVTGTLDILNNRKE